MQYSGSFGVMDFVSDLFDGGPVQFSGLQMALSDYQSTIENQAVPGLESAPMTPVPEMELGQATPMCSPSVLKEDTEMSLLTVGLRLEEAKEMEKKVSKTV